MAARDHQHGAEHHHQRDEREPSIGFEARFEQTARPFEWKFNRADLARLMARLGNATSEPLALCA